MKRPSSSFKGGSRGGAGRDGVGTKAPGPAAPIVLMTHHGTSKGRAVAERAGRGRPVPGWAASTASAAGTVARRHCWHCRRPRDARRAVRRTPPGRRPAPPALFAWPRPAPRSIGDRAAGRGGVGHSEQCKARHARALSHGHGNASPREVGRPPRAFAPRPGQTGWTGWSGPRAIPPRRVRLVSSPHAPPGWSSCLYSTLRATGTVQ